MVAAGVEWEGWEEEEGVASVEEEAYLKQQLNGVDLRKRYRLCGKIRRNVNSGNITSLTCTCW